MKRILYLVCAVFFISAGCEKDTEIVDLTVGWTIGLESPSEEICSRSGITAVHVILDSVSESFERQVVCGEGKIKFEGIPRFAYRVLVSGLNDKGCPIYYGEKQISSGELEEGMETLRLESLPGTGKVTVSWWFPDARFCSHHDVDKVRIVVFRDDMEIVNNNVNCESGSYVIDDALTGRYSILVEAQAEEGFLCNEYHDLVLEPCGSIEAEAALEPCTEGR